MMNNIIIVSDKRINKSLSYIESALLNKSNTFNEDEAAWCHDILEHIFSIKEAYAHLISAMPQPPKKKGK